MNKYFIQAKVCTQCDYRYQQVNVIIELSYEELGKLLKNPISKYEVEKEFADTIADEQIIIEDGGHLNSESGYTEFEELLKWL